MKTAILTLAVALNAVIAFAHTSLVPHEHPHAASPLPDIVVFGVAAVLVGFGLLMLRKFRKE